MIDLDAARADTPGVRETVFLDSAGASLKPRPVVDAVLAHLRREDEVGGYRAAEERADDLARGYAAFARLLGAAPEDVAFTDSATRSWLSLLDAVPLTTGDRVLVGDAEYGANAVALLRLAERSGVSVERVPSDGTGEMSVEALRELLDERVKLVSVVHVPTNGGLVNPARELASAAHEVGALVLLDACQSVGQLPVLADELGVDLVSGTGRKWLRGPRGTGFLVARRAVAERLWPRLIDHTGGVWEAPGAYRLRSDARVHELWEYDIAARLGLVAAAEYALALGIDEIAAEVSARAEHARAALSALPGVQVHDLGERRCGLVSFTVEGVDPVAARDTLRERGVTLTVNWPSASQFDMTRRGLAAVLRASPHYFVTPEEIDRFAGEVGRLARHR